MKGQELVLALFLVCAVAISLISYMIYRSTKHAAEEGEGIKNPLQKRFYFLLLWGGVLIILMSVTIPKSPYFMYKDSNPEKVVKVEAMQYAFIMSDETDNASIEVPAGKMVEFRVTSMDVTHGFAIYNPKHELVTQTQAMPGYVNRLRWVFDEPGKYDILCTEFCGIGHATQTGSMRGEFIVK
ncbi:MAG: cytochrome C oxidase subunit II [Bacteroidia bacterium]|nr:cytochrome C oxidase subunit II [Bacteroidia bacterium]